MTIFESVTDANL